MALLSRNQRRFVAGYLAASPRSVPALVAAQIGLEEPLGANTPVGHSDQNWLNIGNTDSHWFPGASKWKDPYEAGRLSALWTQGKYSVPGFGHAAGGIVAFSRTAGRPLSEQIAALQRSGWASSGYPDLPSMVQRVRGKVGVDAGAAAQQAGAGSMQLPGRLTVTQSEQQQGLAGALLAAQQAASQQRQPIASSPLSAPSFSAQAPLPRGYVAPQGGQAPAPASDSTGGGLTQALQQIAATQPGTSQLVPGQRVQAPGGRGGGGGQQQGQQLQRGRVVLAQGADRAGVPTSRVVRGFVSLVAGAIGQPITITTGSNHDQMTTSGNVSDHWTGRAGDIAVPIDGREGDMIAGHALLLLGVPRLQARKMAQQGGLYTITPKTGPLKGHRVQVIWKTYEGGDHHNHVHIGVE